MNLRSASRTLARTAWQAVPTVIGVILLNFVLMQWIPGDAADVVAAESGSATTLKAPAEGEPLVADGGWSMTGTEKSIELTQPGKPGQTCHT